MSAKYRSTGNLSLVTGLLLKDCLEDQSNLLVPDRGGHVLTVTHTAAVQSSQTGVSRAVVTGGCLDQWKDVEGSRCTPGSVGRPLSLQPRRDDSSAGTQSDCRQQVQGQSGLQWRPLDLPSALPLACKQGTAEDIRQKQKRRACLYKYIFVFVLQDCA